MKHANLVVKSAQRNTEKSSALSWLRIIATIAVVASHAWSTLTDNPDMFLLTGAEKCFLETAYSLLKWPVPCFFMITGALLLKKEKDISVEDYFSKYVKRMLLALVVFGIPYGILMLIFNGHSISFSLIPKAIRLVINGESFGHLWYLYTLIGLYLFLPVIKVIVKYGSKQLVSYMLVLMFVFNFCFPFMNDLLGLEIAFKLPVTTYPLFFLLVGHYIFNEKPAWADHTALAVAGTGMCVVIIILVGITGRSLATVMSYSSPVAAVFAMSIFSLFNKIHFPANQTVWRIDRLCFGVYLIHPLFIQFCYKFLHIVPIGNNTYPISSLVFAIGFTAIAFTASWVMSLIKPLKKYIV